MSDSVAGHAERYLGRARPAVAGGRTLGVAIVLHDHATLSMVTALTDGMRTRSVASPLPLEFACSVRPGQEDEAARLVEMFADLTVRDGSEVEYDDGFLVEEPLVAETSIRGLLAAPHPYADEMFNLYRDAEGELRLQFVTLVPLTAAEGAYLRDHETGELFELWESAGTDLLDLHRSSAV
ncbi:suppressor of fused domain protein [Actinomadura sp. DC4]|uniref:suppressor of fused domain protein n=1 Tax=Actinomadura sp. DC4 TaxID=3055069 RepID=UPI0025B04605|nr:suppressor of fused domain protein [Actinomadura sp. DC4]MDN3358874.1 suppressor of fused domain protein [Actinomadura sp. DC4]